MARPTSKRQKFTTALAPEVIRAVRVRAAWDGSEISDVMEKALLAYLGPLEKYLPKGKEK